MTDVADDATVDSEERSEVEFAIAEQIALLSQATDAPTEFEPTGRAFDADEIDFESPAWMACLAEVQGWLRFPNDLTLDDQDIFLGQLAQGLGLDTVDSAVDSIDGRPRLTAAALDRLNVRLQQAVRLQSEFLADLDEEGGSPTSATASWVEAWEDDLEDEETGGPVSAKADTWAINEFSDRALRGKLNLSPSYQRGDVWPTSDAQMLIESILRGIPLPSVIILKPAAPDAPYEVVDGKQRLTTILRFIGRHPQALHVIKEKEEQLGDDGLRELFESDYPKFRRKWKNLVGEQLTAAKEREYQFPFKLRASSPALSGDLSALQGRYYTQIRDNRIRIADDDIEVGELFERQTQYKIPLIEYSKATPKQIHEVFKLYNKQGKHLNAEEIRNAVYHDVDFMRAILVVAGDNQDMDSVAPFLLPAWDDLSEISPILADYGIGAARYRRTKVLSWLASLLFVDSRDEEGKARKLSTSPHIDSMFERIRNDPSDPLRQHDTIRDALELVLQGMRAHAAVNAWASTFKNPTHGTSWQELQLLGSLLGVTIAASMLGVATEDRLESVASSLLNETSTEAWRRPKKATTGTQWEYMAKTAIWVIAALDVDAEQAAAALEARFGYSSVLTLQAVIDARFA